MRSALDALKPKKTIAYARVSSRDQKADLEKQVELLEDISKSIRQGESGIAEAMPKVLEQVKMKDRLTPELRKEVETLIESCSLHENIRKQP